MYPYAHKFKFFLVMFARHEQVLTPPKKSSRFYLHDGVKSSLIRLNMTPRKQMRRGAVRNGDRVFIGAWLPLQMVQALDEAVTTLDSDRSKIIRDALKEKVQKLGAAR
jgi:hypothetical protein